MSRVHIALTVSDLERSLSFYRVLFGAEPSKVRPGYAKFELEEPSVHLALNEDPQGVRPPGAHSHFGIQLPSTDIVWAEQKRLSGAGLGTKEEAQVACCYSVQDKFWVRDPDGHGWELFVVTEADVEATDSKRTESDCCGPTASAG